MPVERPSLTELITRIIGDIDTRLPDLFAAIPQNPANVFAKAVAGLSHGQYGYIDDQMLQVLPTHATGTNLENWGKFTNTPRRQATTATALVSIVVTSIPTTIDETITFRRSDGALYGLSADVETTTNPFTFEVTALDAGEEGTLVQGTVLVMTSFIAGLGTTVTVTETGEGEDIEDEEVWRGRILGKLRDRPQGGADGDYVAWAKQVPGVGHAWVIASIPPYVDLRITSNDEEDLEASDELIDAVEAYIEDEPDKLKKPVNAILAVASANVQSQNFEFGVFEPNTDSTRTAATDAIEQLLGTADIRKPASLLRRNAVIAAVQNTGVVEQFTLVIPADDVQYGSVAFPVLGDVTFPIDGELGP